MGTRNYNLSESDLMGLTDPMIRKLLKQAALDQERDLKENQLLYYQPVSDKAKAIHLLPQSVDTVGIGGGNGSSKTETSLVELCMCATGIFPQWIFDSLTEAEILDKSRGPMNCRVIVKSLKNQMERIMLRKLQWFVWTGLLPQGGSQGHWGWIPRTSLIDGSWDKSWTAGSTTLQFYHRHPVTWEIDGISSIQFMSSDQEALAMAGNDLQFALLDEPSTLAIWRETQARVMRGRGRIFLAMTWPDDPSIPVDWIFDEIYDRADTDDSVAWVELSTFDNKNLDQESVANMAGKVSQDILKIRYEGKPMRFANLIHPLFTDSPSAWCFNCGAETTILPADPPICATCKGFEVTPYNHVREFDVEPAWPTIFILDPHPRKPHMFCWVQIDPNNDMWMVQEAELAQEPADVAALVARIEAELMLTATIRLIDPNMGKQPCGKRREISWQDEFAAGGLICELADDSGVGRQLLNERMRPDKDTYAPRLHIHPRCQTTIYQMKRYCWDEHRLNAEKDLKQVPKAKHDDFPTMLKYCANFKPDFRSLRAGIAGGVITTRVSKRQKFGSRRVRRP